MARITVEDCLSQIGNENRFSLIHLAVERIKQHRKGAPFLVKCKNKEIVASLREIASGEVSFATIRNFTATKEDTSVPTAQKSDEQPEQTIL
ncbi:MAG: DNA-directed RNA polymerase subunit omega [Desulfobulbaceae bacterium]|nr:DNA-directed RNA polymerase subunit omega [Desulfobulbaceae bacterium]HIJ91657.1 DNA-directed RNA polymerase subunit omega [Deltaproteobacteria bacterium]